MYGENRVSEEYINGVLAFKRAAEQDMLNKGIEFMYCPCIDCGNLKMFNNPAQMFNNLRAVLLEIRPNEEIRTRFAPYIQFRSIYATHVTN